MLERIPRPLLVFVVIFVGIGLFFVAQEPHSVCNSQLPIFQQSQAGALYPKPTKTGTRAAKYSKLVNDCKTGNSAGACFDYFNLLRTLIRDLNASPQECLAPFGELPEVKRALTDGADLLVRLAWGDRPPDPGMTKFGWFEAPDLNLYCQLKSMFIKTYGEEAWEELRISTNKKLPGEAPVIEDGSCLNCDYIKKASEKLSPEEIWSRSLFSLRCELYN